MISREDIFEVCSPELAFLVQLFNEREVQVLPEGFSFQNFLIEVKEHQIATALSDHLPVLRAVFSEQDFQTISGVINGAVLRQLGLTKDLMDLLKSFNEQGIEVVPLKGPMLSHDLFGSFGKRESIDLDFLVNEADYFKAEQVILDAGYQSTHYDLQQFNSVQLKTYQKYFCDSSFVRKDELGWKMVDVHWRLFDSAHFYPREGQRALRTIETQGLKIKQLAPEDLLIYLAIHGSKHQWAKMKWLLDIQKLISKYEQDLDWDSLTSNCISNRIERPVAQALYLSHLLFQSYLHPGVSEMIRTDKKIESMVRESLKVLVQKDYQPNRLLRSLLMLQLKPSRAMYLHYFKRMWLAPQDWMAVRLPKSLFFLYFILRPFLLLTRGFKKRDRTIIAQAK